MLLCVTSLGGGWPAIVASCVQKFAIERGAGFIQHGFRTQFMRSTSTSPSFNVYLIDLIGGWLELRTDAKVTRSHSITPTDINQSVALGLAETQLKAAPLRYVTSTQPLHRGASPK